MIRTSFLMILAGLLTGLAPASQAQDDLIDLDLGEDGLGVVDAEGRRDHHLRELPVRENRAFGPGERLTFSVRYGLIRAGECRLEVLPPVELDGRICLRLVGTAHSSDFFSGIFRVEDRMESYLDREALLPWRFHKDLNEGSYRARQRVDLDQVSRVATYEDGRAFPLDPLAQDALSALYFIRTLDLTPGSRHSFRVHADRKNVDMELHVRGRERVETPAGTFDCLEVEPLILLDSGLYDSRKGKLVMYLTDDGRRVPVLFRIKVLFGSIILTLTDLTEGRSDDGALR